MLNCEDCLSLQWSGDALPTILQSERFPGAATHRELKEMLYHHIIQYFEKGKVTGGMLLL